MRPVLFIFFLFYLRTVHHAVYSSLPFCFYWSVCDLSPGRSGYWGNLTFSQTVISTLSCTLKNHLSSQKMISSNNDIICLKYELFECSSNTCNITATVVKSGSVYSDGSPYRDLGFAFHLEKIYTVEKIKSLLFLLWEHLQLGCVSKDLVSKDLFFLLHIK